MTATARVTDQGPSHKYRTEVPNLVLELGLRPFPLALYLHLKRTAGDGGQCEKTSRRIAAEMGGISVAAISAAKAELAVPREALGGKALIEVHPIADGKGTRFARDVITIVDVWPENMDRFGRSADPAAVHIPNGEPPQSPPTVHSMNRAVHIPNGGRSQYEQGRSYCEHEEEPIKEEPIGKNPSGRTMKTTSANPRTHALFVAICDACGFDPLMLDGQSKADAGALAAECLARGFSEDLIRYAEDAWYTVKFNFKAREDVKPPHVKQLRPWIGQCARRIAASERQNAPRATSRRAPIDYGV